MSNTIEAAERIEQNITSLEEAFSMLLEVKDLKKIESIDQRITEMKHLIEQNKKTAEYIRSTATL